MFSLKTENKLSSRCDSGREIEKSGGALSPMKGTTREGLRKRVAVLNGEIGKMKAYGDEINDPINDYVSEEMNAPSRDIRLARGRARRAWRDLTGIEGRACVVRRRERVNRMASARPCRGALNGGERGEGRGEKESMEAGGEGQSEARRALQAGSIRRVGGATGNITCFVSTHTGSRRARREAGSRSEMAIAGRVARFRDQRIHWPYIRERIIVPLCPFVKLPVVHHRS